MFRALRRYKIITRYLLITICIILNVITNIGLTYANDQDLEHRIKLFSDQLTSPDEKIALQGSDGLKTLATIFGNKLASAVPALEKTINHPKIEIRYNTLNTLSLIGGPATDALPALLTPTNKISKQANEVKLQNDTINYLKNLDDALPTLYKMLDSYDEFLITFAISEFNKNLNRYTNLDPNVRSTFIAKLGEIIVRDIHAGPGTAYTDATISLIDIGDDGFQKLIQAYEQKNCRTQQHLAYLIGNQWKRISSHSNCKDFGDRLIKADIDMMASCKDEEINQYTNYYPRTTGMQILIDGASSTCIKANDEIINALIAYLKHKDIVTRRYAASTLASLTKMNEPWSQKVIDALEWRRANPIENDDIDYPSKALTRIRGY